MRILFAAIPQQGHLRPMLPLADALAAVGHEVTIVTGDGVDGVADRLWPAGVSAAEFEKLAEQHHPPGMRPRDGFEFALGTLFTRLLAPRMLPGLLSAIDELSPDLLIHETGEYATPLAGTLRSVPWLQHSYGIERPAALRRRAAEAVAPLWADHGAGVPSSAGQVGRGYLDICPPSLQLREPDEMGHRLLLQPVDVSGGSPERQAADRPLVLVTFGTVFNRDISSLTRLLTAIAELPVDVVVTTGPGSPAESFGQHMANVTVVDYVPLAAILPACSAVVTHGGSGTMLASLAYGVPLVMVPQGADQFLNAAQVASAGAGVDTGGDGTVGASTDMLDADPSHVVPQLLMTILESEAFARRAREIAEEIAAMPSAASVASEVEMILHGRRAHGRG